MTDHPTTYNPFEDTGDWPFRESAAPPAEQERPFDREEHEAAHPPEQEPPHEQEPESEHEPEGELEPEPEHKPEPEPIHEAEPGPELALAPSESEPEPEAEAEAEAKGEEPSLVAASAPEPEGEPVEEPEPEPQAALAEPVEEDEQEAAEAEQEPEPAEPSELGEPLLVAAATGPALVAEQAPEHAPGELLVPEGPEVLEGGPNGFRRTVAVVVSRFNADVTNRLLESAIDALVEAHVTRESITVVPVPGAFELPLAAMALAKTRRFSCIVAVGCVIRGETPHFDYVAGEAASGLQLAAIETGVPVSFGVLTVDTAEQAEARTGRAADAVRTALEMADVFAQLRASARS